VITLALDAATYEGTVAVLDDERVIVESKTAMRGKDVERLMPAVESSVRSAGLTLSRLDRMVCGSGPGSFTSLRIAASIAKGLAVGRSIPLFAVSSLALIVAGNVKDGPRGPRRYFAALDALREESFVEELEHDAGTVRSVTTPRLMRSDEVQATAEKTNARAVGPELPGAWAPHARGVSLMLAQIIDAGPVDLAVWEPRYGRMAEAQVKWEAEHGRPLPR
jgi:tRNA threonylcarbamoyladenosine biosynthesis protein TsaB